MNQEMTTRNTIDGVQILELNGRFDANEVAGVKDWLTEQENMGNYRILIDMSGVNFIDTRALSSLVMGMKRCRQHGGWFRLHSLQQSVRIIFELTLLNQVLDIFADEAEALNAVVDGALG